MTEKHVVKTDKCGNLNVFVQGDPSKAADKACFLTIHDMGSNYQNMVDFVNHPVMKETKDRSIFIHVSIPGQEDNAADLPNDFTFPKMQQIAEDLVSILDQLSIKLVIALGEGAGANILARFGMKYQERCMGLVLLHCTSTTAGVMEHFKDKILNWKLSNVGMNPTAEQYLIFHKFGHVITQGLRILLNKKKILFTFKQGISFKINDVNKYIIEFFQRTDYSAKLATQLKVETLLVTGSKASHIHTVHTMHQSCNKTKTSLIKFDDVGDVLAECPEKFAQSLQLFCKGLGILTSLPLSDNRGRTISGSSFDEEGRPRRQRTMSMEEYDTPNIRRFSFSNQQTAN
ncbi:unnamed protein product, partial [Meganyctiphanes norvegica]